jgi:hypothetical protein
MGHTPNALNLFKAFEAGCRSFSDFKSKILKETEATMSHVYNDENSDKYLLINIFGGTL